MAPPLVEIIPKSNQLERQWNSKLFPNLNEIDELFLELFEPKGFNTLHDSGAPSSSMHSKISEPWATKKC